MLTGKQDAKYFDFLHEKTGLKVTEKQAKTITRLSDEGEILAVVAFTMHPMNIVEIIVAVEKGRRLTKDLVRSTAKYAFEQIKADMMVAYVPEAGEAKVAKLCEKFGMNFQKTSIVKHLTTGEVIEHVYGLKRSDCKWLTI